MVNLPLTHLVVVADAATETPPEEPELRMPTKANTKADVQAYLDEVGVEYPEDATKAELLELVEE